MLGVLPRQAGHAFDAIPIAHQLGFRLFERLAFVTSVGIDAVTIGGTILVKGGPAGVVGPTRIVLAPVGFLGGGIDRFGNRIACQTAAQGACYRVLTAHRSEQCVRCDASGCRAEPGFNRMCTKRTRDRSRGRSLVAFPFQSAASHFALQFSFRMDHVIIDRETRVWMHNDRLSDDSTRGLRLTCTRSAQALAEALPN